MDEITQLLGRSRSAGHCRYHTKFNDIERACNIARKMVTEYGMSENLGPIAYGGMRKSSAEFEPQNPYICASAVDDEVRKIVQTAIPKPRTSKVMGWPSRLLKPPLIEKTGQEEFEQEAQVLNRKYAIKDSLAVL